ncbi:MAG: FAD-binding oxidoreductase [Acidimicrobiia bacterium]
MQSSRADTTTLSFPALRNDLHGTVIAPGDPDYEAARTIFYAGFDASPAVIIRPVDATEVSYVVSLAQKTGLELAIRSGGHSSAGHGLTEGGIVLDLADMRGLEIDVDAMTAWAETGLTTGEYTVAAAEHGLATGFGDTGSVGIGGITLGGGVGLLVRKHGLTIDHLLAAEMVTADGQILRVDDETNPDLFWAIRGGGGNFGVATRFEFRLHEVDTIVGGMLVLPATAEVIASFVAEAEAAADELSTIANVMTAPPMPFIPTEYHGKPVVFGLLAYDGAVDAGERAVAAFRSLATPIVDMVGPIKYPELFMNEQEEFHPMGVGHNMFMEGVGVDEAEIILEHLEASSAMMAVTQLRVLGGAVARVPVDATAFAHRNKRIMTNVAALYADPEQASVQEHWVEKLASALSQGDDDAYVNFLDDGRAQGVATPYPEPTWDRLRQVKSRYDPDNLFRRNHNIPPA